MKQALADALEHRGYDTLTPVQEAVTEAELTGKDLLVSAQTGSGKTLGFGLAIAPTLLGDREEFGAAEAPLALIIAPTRELALQVKRELEWLYFKTGARLASCVGGMDMRDERRALNRGAHIVVATPGRLRDHIERGSIDLGDIRAVVLDEADEMLDLGFREDLEFILGEAPEDRQTLLFSATVPKMIATLAKKYQNDAVRVSTTQEKTQHADIQYQAMNVAPRDAENAIINVLRFYEAPNALVFCNTRAMVGRMTTRLSNRGFSVVALSGELSQTERTHALQAMRDGRARVCVATDVAARGIDLPNLDLVIHAELPSNSETLLHRSGRTGRAGRKGISALVVPPSQRKKAERLLKFAKLNATWGAAPSAEAVAAKDEERMMDDPAWLEEITEAERPSVDKLTERFTAEQIAGAFMRLYGSKHSAPEELSEVASGGGAREERPPFGPSIWFSVAGGREIGAEARRILPMLCKMGDLTKEDIGAIRVRDRESFVEIRESAVKGFVKALGPNMTVEDDAPVTQLKEPPAGIRSARPGGPRPGGRDDRSGGRKPRGKFDRGERGSWNDRDDRPPRHERPAREGRPARAEKTYRPERPVSEDGPERTERAERPKSTPPVQYDDAREAKPKKPKPGAKKLFQKGPKPDLTRGGAVTASNGPKRKEDGAKGPSKGPKPPKGKPNSKKNKARAAAKAAEKGGMSKLKRG